MGRIFGDRVSTHGEAHGGAQPEGPRSFEQAFGELEERVRALEKGELPLEQALTLYEQGVELQRECQELLDQAEQRIVELCDGAQGLETPPTAGGPPTA